MILFRKIPVRVCSRVFVAVYMNRSTHRPKFHPMSRSSKSKRSRSRKMFPRNVATHNLVTTVWRLRTFVSDRPNDLYFDTARWNTNYSPTVDQFLQEINVWLSPQTRWPRLMTKRSSARVLLNWHTHLHFSQPLTYIDPYFTDSLTCISPGDDSDVILTTKCLKKLFPRSPKTGRSQVSCEEWKTHFTVNRANLQRIETVLKSKATKLFSTITTTLDSYHLWRFWTSYDSLSFSTSSSSIRTKTRSRENGYACILSLQPSPYDITSENRHQTLPR